MMRPYSPLAWLAALALAAPIPTLLPMASAVAQTSPPPGVLRAPPPGARRPAKTETPPPPKAAPVVGVQRVEPYQGAHAGSALGHSAPGHSAPGHSVGGREVAHGKPRRTPVVSAPRAPQRRAGKPVHAAAGHRPPAKVEAAKPAAAAVAGVAAGVAVANAGKPGAPPPPVPAVPPAPARPEIDPHKGAVTGLPLPRWVALRSADVNMRTGPGMRYPVEWQYHRRNLPVKLEREFEVWRLVEDQDGVKGWVHQANLTSSRGFVLKGPEQVLRARPSDSAGPVALIKPGVLGRITSCGATASWCQVRAGGYSGWLKRATLWGILPGEAIGG